MIKYCTYFVLLMLLYRCGQGNIESSKDKNTVNNTSFQKTDEGEKLFKNLYRNAVRKIDLLTSLYRKSHPIDSSILPGPATEEVKFIEESDLRHFSKLEYLVFCCLKKESYRQMCAMHFPVGYSQTLHSIYNWVWSGDPNEVATARIERIKKDQNVFYPLMDSILSCGENQDSNLLIEVANLYSHCAPKQSIKKLLSLTRKGENRFFASALLDQLSRLDEEFIKNQPIGKYFYDTSGYLIINEETGLPAHIYYIAKNIDMVVQCGEKWLTKP